MKKESKKQDNLDDYVFSEEKKKEIKTEIKIAFAVSVISFSLFLILIFKEKLSLDYIKYSFKERKYKVFVSKNNSEIIKVSGSKFLTSVINDLSKKKQEDRNFSFSIESIGSKNAVLTSCYKNKNKPDIMVLSRKLNKYEKAQCILKGMSKDTNFFKKISLVPLTYKESSLSNIEYKDIKSAFYKKNNIYLLDNESSKMFFKKKFLFSFCKKKLNIKKIDNKNLKNLNLCVNNFDLSSILIKEEYVEKLLQENKDSAILITDDYIDKFRNFSKIATINDIDFNNDKYYLSYKLYFYIFNQDKKEFLVNSVSELQYPIFGL